MVGCNYRKRMKSNDVDLMALSELELRELFKKVDWSEVDPTIDEIESELENEVDRFMSLTAEEYRNEIGIKSEKVKNGKVRKSKKG